jgi:hypothetical protein
MLEELGFNNIDVWMLTLCPVMGVIGSFIHVFTTDIDYSITPKASNFNNIEIDDETRKVIVEHRGLWIGSRLFIGGATGLLLALYFAGAITHEATSVGRLLALSIMAGYVSPSFWKNQKPSRLNDLIKS